MQTWSKVVNWIAIAIFGLVVIALGLMQPSSTVPAALNLIPFGLVLLAVRPDSRPVAARFAIGFNALWALLYLLVMGFAGYGVPGGLLVMGLFCVPVVALCALNIKVLWSRASAPGQG